MNRRSFFGTVVGLISIPFIKSKVLPEPKLPPMFSSFSQLSYHDLRNWDTSKCTKFESLWGISDGGSCK